MTPEEQSDDDQRTAIRSVPDAAGSQPTSVSNPVVDPYGDTSESAALKPETVPPAPPAPETRTWPPAGGESPAQAQERGTEDASDPFSDRPHVWVAGAFVGGIVLAQVLKSLGRGDDD